MNNLILFSILGLALLFLIWLIIILQRPHGRQGGYEFPGDEWEQREAGREGEILAAHMIKKVLRQDDVLLSNVSISYEGKQTELDEVIINTRGVYIIEVKNYSGKLKGRVEDHEWQKYKISGGGNLYEKQVRNPLRQVKREIYILSNYLKDRGIHVWVDGYVFFVEGNSPVKDSMVLWDYKDVDRIIHKQGRNHLQKRTVDQIAATLRNQT